MIPGQKIIMGKQVSIHVYSIEVRYFTFIYIVNPLHGRVYRPFQGDAFVDHFLLIVFHVMFLLCCLVCSLRLCGRLLGGAGFLVLLCVACSRVFVLGCINS